MAKTKDKPNPPAQPTRPPLFEVGDVVMNLKKNDPLLILGIDGDEYIYMHLRDQYFGDTFGHSHVIKKGSKSNQPMDIVERHHSLYVFESC